MCRVVTVCAPAAAHKYWSFKLFGSNCTIFRNLTAARTPSYSSHRRFQGEFRFPLINPPAPSPPTSLGAAVRGARHLGGGLCIVDIGLLASFGRRWLLGCWLPVELTSIGGGWGGGGPRLLELDLTIASMARLPAHGCRRLGQSVVRPVRRSCSRRRSCWAVVDASLPEV
jgi:hypothetical protein